jgi:hypothetical protein
MMNTSVVVNLMLVSIDVWSFTAVTLAHENHVTA